MFVILPLKLVAKRLPAYKLPLTPAPPTTTKAPVVALDEAVPEPATKLPNIFVTPDTLAVPDTVNVSTTELVLTPNLKLVKSI